MKTKTNNRPKNKRLEQLSKEVKKLFDNNPSESINTFLESLLEVQYLSEKHRKYINSLPTFEHMTQESQRIRKEYFDKKSNGKLSEKELQEIDKWKQENKPKIYSNMLDVFLENK